MPLSENALQWLTPYADKRNMVWTAGHDAFYDAQQATAKAAGVKWKGNAMRHSYVSYRLAQIKNAAQVALECGNSAQMIFRHYRELVKESDAVKWFSISPIAPANVTPMATANRELTGYQHCGLHQKDAPQSSVARFFCAGNGQNRKIRLLGYRGKCWMAYAKTLSQFSSKANAVGGKDDFFSSQATAAIYY